MNLTDVKVRNAKPREKPYKLYDGEGLFLHITPVRKFTPKGGRYWRLRYKYSGKDKLLALGTYPGISLATARRKKEDARKLIANGIDPSVVRKVEKYGAKAGTFKAVANEWHENNEGMWTKGHAKTIKSRLERDVFPWLGDRPIEKITAPELLMTLRKIESRGAIESAHRIKSLCGQVFRYAIATGRAERDWSADLRGALKPVKSRHFPALIEPDKVAGLLRAIDGYQGSYVVKCALKLAPLTFLRPGELRHGEWKEIDLEQATWSIPGERMKIKEPHVVPLAGQTISILKDLYCFTGSSKYIFPSGRTFSRPMSENAVNAALRRMGFESDEMTGHGFRAMARTMLDEILHFPADIIEHQLAHAVKDPLGRAYNRTKHIEERIRMMQTWADYLDGLKAGAKVIPFKAAKR